jgi:hypothetical protein
MRPLFFFRQKCQKEMRPLFQLAMAKSRPPGWSGDWLLMRKLPGSWQSLAWYFVVRYNGQPS